jgi:uncharacterized membrane protein
VGWPGFVALGVLAFIARRLIFWRWRRSRLGHRQAAALWASIIPLILVVIFAMHGINSFDEALLLGGLVVLTFVPSYAMIEFMLRAFGGEMDPPQSSRYRRRP